MNFTNGRIQTAFVTGGTGLLGNNLVRLLLAHGLKVKTLVRSPEKAGQLFADLPNLEWVHGDLQQVASFAERLEGCEVLFHTAAHFRESYQGGNHRRKLAQINVEATGVLLQAAYTAEIRRFVQTSSIAVLDGAPNSLIDEQCQRRLADADADADAYYRSKILADCTVDAFLHSHPEMHASFVLPGWMWGPGDLEPTSSGQLAIDIARGKLAGVVPGSVSIVDARDVAMAHWAAAIRGRRGERYLAAGRHIQMHELIPMIARAAGAAAPTRRLSLPLLYLLAGTQELWARIARQPILLSLATIRLMAREADRSHFNHAKSERELGLSFRAVEDTLHETIDWYRQHQRLP